MSVSKTEFRSAASRIELEDQPSDLSFSPNDALVSVGLMNGEITFYMYNRDVQHQEEELSERLDEEFEQEITEKALLKPAIIYTYSYQCHLSMTGAISIVLFSLDGATLAAAYSVGGVYLFDPGTGKKIKSMKSKNGGDIYRIENVDMHRLASGDDTGVIKVKIWDVRSRHHVATIKAHVDYITDLAYLPSSRELVSSSGDTSLVMTDLRKFDKAKESHDGFKEEPTSLQPLSHGDHIICGTSTGKIAIFCPISFEKTHSWFTGNVNALLICSHCKDAGGSRIHHDSIDALVSLDDQTILTGCADGAIRMLRFHPNRFLGVVGRQKYPDSVERLAISHDDAVLGSIGIDSCLRLWDIQNLTSLDDLKQDDVDNSQLSVSDGERTKRSRSSPTCKVKKKLKKKQIIPNFFSDLTRR